MCGKITSKSINTEQFFTSVILKKKNGDRKILNRSHCQKNSCWEGSFKGGSLDIFLNSWQQPSGPNWTDSMEVLLSPVLQEETIFPWSHVVKYLGFYIAKCHIKVSLVDSYPDNEGLQSFQMSY